MSTINSLKTEKLHDILGSIRQIIDINGDMNNYYTYNLFVQG